MADVNAREIAQDYKSSLSDLTVNSKPLITMLTMLAEENIEHAAHICDVLVNYTKEATVKLPVMYLIDSIIKNVGGDYKRLINIALVNMFASAFKSMDESNRRKMYELRQTWNEVFPKSKLYHLDATVKDIDPAWPTPIKGHPEPAWSTASRGHPAQSSGSSMHINPKFKAGSSKPIQPSTYTPETAMQENFPKPYCRQPCEIRKDKILIQDIIVKDNSTKSLKPGISSIPESAMEENFPKVYSRHSMDPRKEEGSRKSYSRAEASSTKSVKPGISTPNSALAENFPKVYSRQSTETKRDKSLNHDDKMKASSTKSVKSGISTPNSTLAENFPKVYSMQSAETKRDKSVNHDDKMKVPDTIINKIDAKVKINKAAMSTIQQSIHDKNKIPIEKTDGAIKDPRLSQKHIRVDPRLTKNTKSDIRDPRLTKIFGKNDDLSHGSHKVFTTKAPTNKLASHDSIKVAAFTSKVASTSQGTLYPHGSNKDTPNSPKQQLTGNDNSNLFKSKDKYQIGQKEDKSKCKYQIGHKEDKSKDKIKETNKKHKNSKHEQHKKVIKHTIEEYKLKRSSNTKLKKEDIHKESYKKSHKSYNKDVPLSNKQPKQISITKELSGRKQSDKIIITEELPGDKRPDQIVLTNELHDNKSNQNFHTKELSSGKQSKQTCFTNELPAGKQPDKTCFTKELLASKQPDKTCFTKELPADKTCVTKELFAGKQLDKTCFIKELPAGKQPDTTSFTKELSPNKQLDKPCFTKELPAAKQPDKTCFTKELHASKQPDKPCFTKELHTSKHPDKPCINRELPAGKYPDKQGFTKELPADKTCFTKELPASKQPDKPCFTKELPAGKPCFNRELPAGKHPDKPCFNRELPAGKYPDKQSFTKELPAGKQPDKTYFTKELPAGKQSDKIFHTKELHGNMQLNQNVLSKELHGNMQLNQTILTKELPDSKLPGETVLTREIIYDKQSNESVNSNEELLNKSATRDGKILTTNKVDNDPKPTHKFVGKIPKINHHTKINEVRNDGMDKVTTNLTLPNVELTRHIAEDKAKFKEPRPPEKKDTIIINANETSLFGTEDIDLRTLSMPKQYQHKKKDAELQDGVNDVPTKVNADCLDDHQDKMKNAVPITRRSSVNKSNSASWERFRDTDPHYKEYQRQASISDKPDEQDVDTSNVTNHKLPPQLRSSNRNHNEKEWRENRMPEERDFKMFAKDLNDQMQNKQITTEEYHHCMRDIWHRNESDKIEASRRQESSQRIAPTHSEKRHIRNIGRSEWRDLDENSFDDHQCSRQKFDIPKQFETGSVWRRGSDTTYNVEQSNEIDEDDQYYNDEWISPEMPGLTDEVLQTHYMNFIHRQMKIDSVNRTIRIYGDKAIILLNNDDPRLISFKPTKCSVYFMEENIKLDLMTGEGYKKFYLGAHIHQIKLGVPTQELFIDGKGYQCFFGKKPTVIYLDDKNHTVGLNGNPPQVEISKERNLSYLAGRVQLVIDARRIINLYLDAMPQKFHIHGRAFILKFIDSLRAVTINGIKFPIDFEKLPFSITVRGYRRYLRFTGLPPGIIPGKIVIEGMDEDGSNLIPVYTSDHPLLLPSEDFEMNVEEPNFPSQSENLDFNISDSFANNNQISNPDLTFSNSRDNFDNPLNMPGIYQSQKDMPSENLPNSSVISNNNAPLDISSILSSLVKSGVIKDNAVESNRSEQLDTNETEEGEVWDNLPSTTDLWTTKILKTRNNEMANNLTKGLQCSSCGLRFGGSRAPLYSLHLDWHFRMNKKQQEFTKKANYRKHFLTRKEWEVYEEIEDVDERAPSMFEVENENNAENNCEENVAEDIPSVMVSPDNPSLGVCSVCHETFDQFFDDETEDWRYSYAVSMEGANYHPGCHDDLLKQIEKAKLAEQKKEEERIQLLQQQKENLPKNIEKEVAITSGKETSSPSLEPISDVESSQEMEKQGSQEIDKEKLIEREGDKRISAEKEMLEEEKRVNLEREEAKLLKQKLEDNEQKEKEIKQQQEEIEKKQLQEEEIEIKKKQEEKERKEIERKQKQERKEILRKQKEERKVIERKQKEEETRCKLQAIEKEKFCLIEKLEREKRKLAEMEETASKRKKLSHNKEKLSEDINIRTETLPALTIRKDMVVSTFENVPVFSTNNSDQVKDSESIVQSTTDDLMDVDDSLRDSSITYSHVQLHDQSNIDRVHHNEFLKDSNDRPQLSDQSMLSCSDESLPPTISSTAEKNIIEKSNFPDNSLNKHFPADTVIAAPPQESECEGIKIKNEPSDVIEALPLPTPLLLADIPIKMEVVDEPEEEEDIAIIEEVDENDQAETIPSVITNILQSSIDGNTEQAIPIPEINRTLSVPIIRINVSKHFTDSIPEDKIVDEQTNTKSAEDKELIEEFVPPPFSFDSSTKPLFEGVELLDQPVYSRGMEISSLCSIM